jgi:hypothetical protein
MLINNYNLNSMKNKLKILPILAIGIFLYTCQSEPELPMPDLQNGVIPLITKDETKDQSISFSDLGGFDGTVEVGLYYPTDKPKSMDLMVTMNNDPENSGAVKSDITSFPTTADITIASIVDILPGLDDAVDIVPGDFFRFYVDVTLPDGTVINGNDTLYAPYGSEVYNLPDASLDVTYTVVCPLDLNDFVGDYTMDDGYPSDLCTITVSLDPDNIDGLIINNFYGGTGTGALYPVKISVNRTTYGISVPSPQVFAEWLWNPAYLNATLSDLKGTLDACTGNFSFKAQLDVSVGGFGLQSYTCTKIN